MFSTILDFLETYVGAPYGSALPELIILIGIAGLSVASYYVSTWLLGIASKVISHTRTTWDDDLLNARMLRAISQLAPAIIVKWLLTGFFADGQSYGWLTTLTTLYILAAIVGIFIILISNLYNAFLKRSKLRAYAIKGVFQMVQLLLICIAVILAVSIIIGRSPVAVLTALGASAAVLMLVFKDTILGLVASVQLTANNMIKRGDWIVCDKHDANGEVVDISLTTIKVRNWDNSVTTIPPYSLISESFRNYDPMVNSGARRVERSILIDANTVRFCTPEELAKLSEQGWLEGLDLDAAKKQVNLHLLRRYLEHSLASDPRINTSATLMVRQMPPTAAGLPLNLYFFTRTTEWKQFEHIQSDIFDHVYATIGQFGLKVFQSPAGTDIKALKE